MEVVFHRRSTSWNRKEMKHTYVEIIFSLWGKNSTSSCCTNSKHQAQPQTQTLKTGNDSHMNKVQPKWEVQSWEILFDEKKEAMGIGWVNGGISCSGYLKSRKSSSLEALRKQNKCPTKEAKATKKALHGDIQKPKEQVSFNVQSKYFTEIKSKTFTI